MGKTISSEKAKEQREKEGGSADKGEKKGKEKEKRGREKRRKKRGGKTNRTRTKGTQRKKEEEAEKEKRRRAYIPALKTPPISQKPSGEDKGKGSFFEIFWCSAVCFESERIKGKVKEKGRKE